jgi:uncharacterized membrane protein (UPF0127 family)
MDQLQPRGAPRRPILALVLFVSALVVLGCAAKGGPAPDGPTKPNPVLPTAEIRSGSVTLTVELARDEGQRERGLMFRKSLAEGRGMLFVFDADQILAFWMKNTILPLSVAYLTKDGTVREIHDLEPLSLAGVESERSMRYALEVPRGWFERVGIRVGDRFELPPLD